jgi:hypothetical protein
MVCTIFCRCRFLPFWGHLKSRIISDTMQTFATKKAATAYTTTMGWTVADAKLAFKGLPLPIDELALLNIMVRFAGPELYDRQKKQGAQQGVATRRANEYEALATQFSEMVTDYEDQIESDRSAFVPIVKTLYGIAKPFGYRSAWIEALLATYARYTTQTQSSPPQKKAS